MASETRLPSDIEAERFTLAAMMDSPQSIQDAAEILTPECLFRPAHQVMFRAMVAMFAAGEPVDPVTLRAWIERDGDLGALGGLARASEYLIDVYGLHYASSAVRSYARTVFHTHMRRQAIELGQRMIASGMTPVTDLDTIYEQIDDHLDHLRQMDRMVRQPTSYLTTVQFGKDRPAAAAPVIPGLLNHQDRVVVVGGEGAGKTMLSHQVGFCAACGVNPFRWTQQSEPKRVLIMDFEMPAALLASRFEMFARIASGYPGWSADNIMVVHHPGGVDITDARQRFMLTDVVRRAEPDLVIAGPVYKMLLASASEDRMNAAHLRAAAFFDRLRERYDCAIWLEVHAPYAARGKTGEAIMRPEGSNIWSKWPEFGLSLLYATKAHGGPEGLDVRQFRGHREEGRLWPQWITRNHGGGWPWTPNGVPN